MKHGTVSINTDSIEVAVTREQLPTDVENALIAARKGPEVSSMQMTEYDTKPLIKSSLDDILEAEVFPARDQSRFVREYKDT